MTTLAGSTEGFADGTGAAAKFNMPDDVVIESSGALYVADAGNRRIRKVTPSGVVTTLASFPPPPADTSGLLCTETFAIALDKSGNIYVSDSCAHRIRRVSPAGQVTTVAGSGEKGYQEGSATTAKFSEPKGIVVDANGVLYVADYGNHRIRKIGSDGTLSTLAGDGTPEDVDGTGGSAKLSFPRRLAIDASGTLFLTGTGGVGPLRRISSAGVVTKMAELAYASGVTVDGGGRVFALEGGYGRIVQVPLSGALIEIAGEFASIGFQDGMADQAKFDFSSGQGGGLAVEMDGTMYVADRGNHRIRLIK